MPIIKIDGFELQTEEEISGPGSYRATVISAPPCSLGCGRPADPQPRRQPEWPIACEPCLLAWRKADAVAEIKFRQEQARAKPSAHVYFLIIEQRMRAIALPFASRQGAENYARGLVLGATIRKEARQEILALLDREEGSDFAKAMAIFRAAGGDRLTVVREEVRP